MRCCSKLPPTKERRRHEPRRRALRGRSFYKVPAGRSVSRIVSSVETRPAIECRNLLCQSELIQGAQHLFGFGPVEDDYPDPLISSTFDRFSVVPGNQSRFVQIVKNRGHLPVPGGPLGAPAGVGGGNGRMRRWERRTARHPGSHQCHRNHSRENQRANGREMTHAFTPPTPIDNLPETPGLIRQA